MAFRIPGRPQGQGGPSVLQGHRSRSVLFGFFVTLFASAAQGPRPVDSVLRTFLDTDPRSFLVRLEAQRDPAVPPEIKAKILDALPMQGRVTNPGRSGRRKIASLKAVLRAHQRDSVYEVMVIAVPQAFTGLHARVVVLISEPALALLDASELQAVVAHEIAHEYVWAQYEEAQKLQNHKRFQEIELFCDGVAVITMLRLGADPFRLITGLEKITRKNREQFGWARNEDHYPSLTDRRSFATSVARWASGASSNRR